MLIAKTKTKCNWCGKEMIVYKSQIKIGEGKFCSKKCYGLSQRIVDRNKKCLVCGVKIKYSSTYCVKHSQLGKRGPNWQGGKTKQSKLERNRLWASRWAKTIYERDNWNCQSCGKHGGKLHAHHILSFAKFPNKRFDISNGITLCETCHRKVHK